MEKHKTDVPLYGCILIGGKSSRMGQPKHLLTYKGKTWLELIAQTLLAEVCEKVIISGDGKLPVGNWETCNDLENCHGPLSGILAVLEKYPKTNFIICSCDIPYVNEKALKWLVQQVEKDDLAVLPSLDENYIEPLFAYYNYKIKGLLYLLAEKSSYKLSEIQYYTDVKTVFPPRSLHKAWKNCNTVSDIP